MEKWPFLDQNHGLTPLQKCQFFEFFSFYGLERRSFAREYRKRDFPGLHCPKNKVGKMAIFGQKPRVNCFEKCQFFDFSSFYGLQRRFFALEYRKRRFPGLYCLKKKVEKMPIFPKKPWVNPFGKIAIFRLFELLFFYSLEKRF